ncbi:MAG: TA system VapC family ribonuclease toxin [Kineosporiaceae bacterium]
MIAVDTNVLVYAHRQDSPHHDAARAAVADLAGSRGGWGVPWPCVHEFYSIVTHPRVYDPPTSPGDALRTLDDLAQLHGVRFLGEVDDHLTLLAELIERSGVAGPKVHDARIAAICLGHGVRELWTADRDFSYFPALKTRNPLV